MFTLKLIYSPLIYRLNLKKQKIRLTRRVLQHTRYIKANDLYFFRNILQKLHSFSKQYYFIFSISNIKPVRKYCGSRREIHWL